MGVEKLDLSDQECPLCGEAMLDDDVVIRRGDKFAHYKCVEEYNERMLAKYGPGGAPKNRRERRLYKRNPDKFRKMRVARSVKK